MDIKNSITTLKGVGKKRAEAFKKEGIKTLKDLINFIPNRYEDRTLIGGFDSPNEELTIQAKVTKRGSLRYIRKNYNILVIPVTDQSNREGEIIFFNQPYLINQFKQGQEYYFFGKVNKEKKHPRMFSPKFSSIQNQDFLTVTPIYRKLNNIPESLIHKLINIILSELEFYDFLPQKYREENNLISQKDMYHFIHQPKSMNEVKKAINRLKVNEGLKINSGITSIKMNKEVTDLVITNFNCVEPFIKKLPFKLTDSQNFVLREIFRDLEKGYLMNRMIQGDVGSGKTIIAIICAYLFCMNGLQIAYMAPTEILAKQHYQTFKEFFAPYNINIELLVGSQNKKENDRIRKGLKQGTVNIVIGTHALIQESTEFYNLGLIVTDEQHRFGVKQRGQLEQKGTAHILVMSATPIPRTLALTLYGDLDLSVINEMPLGRKKVKTSFHSIKKLRQVLNFTEEEIKKGHQAFIVCPFIEKSEEMKDVVSVEQAYQEIKENYGNRFRIEMLHSKLPNDQKEEVIEKFNKGEIDLLIATSIIEVGINVPNVSVITILSADRFGLSQLHQLRGRTGRSDIQSYCFLLSNNKSKDTLERMKTIVNCHDGQKIAEADLKLRGPGEYFGFQQHGFGNVKFINPVEDAGIFELSKNLVEKIFHSPIAEDMRCKDFLIKEFQEDLKYITLD